MRSYASRKAGLLPTTFHIKVKRQSFLWLDREQPREFHLADSVHPAPFFSPLHRIARAASYNHVAHALELR